MRVLPFSSRGAKALLVSGLLTVSSAAPAMRLAEASTTTVYEFPNGTWLENLAVRSNGDVLVTLVEPTAAVYSIDPISKTPSLVHAFKSVGSVLGISEYEPNRFAVIGGNISFAPAPRGIPGSWGIFTIDLRNASKPAIVEQVAALKSAELLNGLAAYNSTTVLAGDSTQGVIYSIDIPTGAYTVALDRPEFKVTESGSIPLGVNGLQYRNGNLYFTNSNQNIAGYFAPVGAGDSSQWSNAVILANDTARGLPGVFDDFDFSVQEGYFARSSEYTIDSITNTGYQTTIAGSPNSTAIADPTSAKLGRTPSTLDILYVTTNGGLGGSLGNQQIIGGQLVAVDLSSLGGAYSR